jgi:hypothetical protein
MKYYGSLGHVRATLIHRYFVSEDEEVRKGALEDVRKEMGIIVSFSWHSYIDMSLICNSSLNLFYSNLAPTGNMAKVWTGQDNWKVPSLSSENALRLMRFTD